MIMVNKKQVIGFTWIILDCSTHGGMPFHCHSYMDQKWVSVLGPWGRKPMSGWQRSNSWKKRGGDFSRIKVPTGGDFLAALLPLICIPAVLTLCSGLYKWKDDDWKLSRGVYIFVGVGLILLLCAIAAVTVIVKPWTVSYLEHILKS
ncbi:hypothetical protein IFM89_038751 [Coptis chinensis]|uniref:Uncharacterized protein n=1 Tax=Coptis chinensis TaxID=261450 RepID=A0A835LU23_9MAGN|nr:hypothetical protein IFM89_038751 [Coptis chinensis]